MVLQFIKWLSTFLWLPYILTWQYGIWCCLYSDSMIFCQLILLENFIFLTSGSRWLSPEMCKVAKWLSVRLTWLLFRWCCSLKWQRVFLSSSNCYHTHSLTPNAQTNLDNFGASKYSLQSKRLRHNNGKARKFHWAVKEFSAERSWQIVQLPRFDWTPRKTLKRQSFSPPFCFGDVKRLTPSRRSVRTCKCK